MQKLYTDIDYESFPVADLDLDLHWIQLPKAVYAAKCKARREAEERELLEKLPDHKIILVPADPNYSPKQTDLWPIINRAVQRCLQHHPEVNAEVTAAVDQALAEHRGWRNPHPPIVNDLLVKK